MVRSRQDGAITQDEFLKAILDTGDRAGAAAFAAAILEGGGSGREMSGRTRDISYEDWLHAVLPGALPSRTSEILHEYNFDPNQPRDENGRWTTDGRNDDQANPMTQLAQAPSTARAGVMSDSDLQKIVAQLQTSPAAKKLYVEAQKALSADKQYRGKGALIINLFPDPKTFPKPNVTGQPVPDVAKPNASNPKTGTIWIDANDPRETVLETLLVELAHLTRRKEFIDLVDNAGKYTRDDFIHKMEEYEFRSMQRAAQVWKDSWKDWNSPRDTPSWGNPDNVLKMTFKEHWDRLPQWHKEIYGGFWDTLTR